MAAGSETGGCLNCYAARQALRMSGPGGAYEGLVRLTENGPRWTGKVRLEESMLDWPLDQKKPLNIFVDSMSDLFHEALSFEEIERVFGVMKLADWHTYQVLTKRGERMREYFKWRGEPYHSREIFSSQWAHWSDPMPHVWLGVSVEDGNHLDRIEHLRNTPAAVRFVSFEPLLGFIPSSAISTFRKSAGLDLRGIDWAIVGGESGPDARPMHPHWVRRIHNACRAYGTAFFFKQWGQYSALAPYYTSDHQQRERALDTRGNFLLTDTGYRWSVEQDGQPPSATWIMCRNKNKHTAGRLLDGREWNEMPSRAPQEASR